MPGELWAYIRQASGRDQIGLSALTILVFLLTLVPLELQRRVVNDAIGSRHLPSILLLCLAYVVVVLVQGGLKLWLNIYRALWRPRARTPPWRARADRCAARLRAAPPSRFPWRDPACRSRTRAR